LLPGALLGVTKPFSLLIVTILAVIAVACGSSSVTEVAGPSPRCEVAVNAPPNSVPASGAIINASVTVARECAWTAASDAPWLQVNPTSGQGEATVTLTVVENAVAQARSGTLTINDRRFNVLQQAADCYFQFNAPSFLVGPQAGTLKLVVTTRVGCGWSAETSESWVRVVPSSGTGPADAAIYIEQNGRTRRAAQVALAGHLIRIEQEALAALPEPPAPPSPVPPPAPAPQPTPTPSPDPSPTPTPDDDGGKGKGKGNENGKGNDKNGRDDSTLTTATTDF
jgi:hypothetical protein